MTSTNPLPRGRHKLSREFVAATQRERMLLACAQAMSEKGYAGTPVAAILERAGVSRETFYQQFGSKQDCFLATLDRASALFVERLSAALGEVELTPDLFPDFLGIYLDTIADEPDLARVFLVESYAAGPEAIAHRAALQHRFVDALALLYGEAAERFALEVLVAAVGAKVSALLLEGDVEAIRELHGPFVAVAGRLFDSPPGAGS
ncbi:TetR/AcrR family transcriptional regulator [Streptomyces sp. XM4193]|uniref:TetR/AcrR family transcriptional regulator n=1 Tax=Streptomyces sp. XM4193 TaxID=2929782 RepID=UPI001FFB30BE|nr:TetR/AcrR family transcriptional regulator [Streptomyces sp. XM4193]MCK1797678.1 TetR/AcrR family transcriptional regulator [Streptomyces sp. XM4193]